MESLGERTLTRWRLLRTEPGAGAWNMALDEALFESVRAGGAPFLRFYRWNPATLSLGRFQGEQGLSEFARTVPQVRRPTGGGGIWHADELTYSLGCTQDNLGLTGVKASFERLCGFLLDAWSSLGWTAHYAKDGARDSLGVYTPACFAGSEEYDVMVRGRKLGGNAQRRDRSFIFQHGSIPYTLDHSVLESLFLPGFRPDPELVTDLATCGWSGTEDELTSLLSQTFQQRLDVEWEVSSPTNEELVRTEELVSERFGSRDWTERGGGSLRP